MAETLKGITCPNCGANTTNQDVCEFCGSIIIRDDDDDDEYESNKEDEEYEDEEEDKKVFEGIILGLFLIGIVLYYRYCC